MNRVITSRGIMSGGVVVRGTQGVDLAYDAASERVSATTTVGANMHVERYGYDAAGNMTNIHVADAPSAPGTGALKSTLTYDILNRMTRQQDWTGDGTGIAYDRAVTYDAKNRETYEAVTQKQGNDLLISYTTSSYADALAGATYVYTDVHTLTNGDPSKWVRMPSPDTTTTYDWYDGAVQSTVVYRPDYIKTPSFSSYYYYSPTGTFSSAYVSDGRPRTVTVTNDAMGQAIKRDESDQDWTHGDPHEIWYRFNGKQMGYVGNNGTVDVGYTASIATITAAASSATGAFRGGASTGTAFADFDQNYTPVNAYSQGSSGGSYTIQGGETLSDIASQEWGDSSLWYKIAEANGLTGNETLVAGQTLLLPGGINAVNNNSTTFKPYDPSDAYGNTSPTTPKPQKKNPCGVFGQILAAVVAAAVSALVEMIPVVGPLLAPIAGDAASQGVLIATGNQKKFSWDEVGKTAVEELVPTAHTGNPIVDAAIAAARNVAVQGIEIAVGLKHDFSWSEVAGAAVQSAVSYGLGQAMHAPESAIADVGQRVVRTVAYTVSDAATRSLIDGTDFGDNIVAALPSALGRTAGEYAMDAATGKLDYQANRDAGDARRAAKKNGSDQPAASSGASGAPTAPPPGDNAQTHAKLKVTFGGPVLSTIRSLTAHTPKSSANENTSVATTSNGPASRGGISFDDFLAGSDLALPTTAQLVSGWAKDAMKTLDGISISSGRSTRPSVSVDPVDPSDSSDQRAILSDEDKKYIQVTNGYGKTETTASDAQRDLGVDRPDSVINIYAPTDETQAIGVHQTTYTNGDVVTTMTLPTGRSFQIGSGWTFDASGYAVYAGDIAVRPEFFNNPDPLLMGGPPQSADDANAEADAINIPGDLYSNDVGGEVGNRNLAGPEPLGSKFVRWEVNGLVGKDSFSVKNYLAPFRDHVTIPVLNAVADSPLGDSGTVYSIEGVGPEGGLIAGPLGFLQRLGRFWKFGDSVATARIPQVTLNKAAGDAFEADVIENVLPKTQVNIQPQITIKSNGPSGLKVRLDALGEDMTSGATRLSDMKASSTAPFTPNQTVVYPELELYGGVVVGKGKAPFVGGTSIPPTAVDVIRKVNR